MENLKDGEQYVVEVPAKQIPPWRYKIAHKDGVKQIMCTTWGGMGDQAVAEPTLRYIFELFEGYEISLLTSFPELFTHLPFKAIHYKTAARKFKDHEWLALHTNPPDANMTRDFMSHHFTQVTSFCSLSAIQRELPLECRQVKFVGSDFWKNHPNARIVVHPGRHWPIKTFPKEWWNAVLKGLTEKFEGRVVVIGRDIDKNTGTVDVDIPYGAIDLRNKLSLGDLISICKTANVVVTNDSSPLHIAPAGNAHIFFIASCKQPEHLTHWRVNQDTGQMEFGWRMKNLGRDGLWNHQSSIPIRNEDFTIDTCPPGLMEKILPTAKSVVHEVEAIWTGEKVTQSVDGATELGDSQKPRS